MNTTQETKSAIEINTTEKLGNKNTAIVNSKIYSAIKTSLYLLNISDITPFNTLVNFGIKFLLELE